MIHCSYCSNLPSPRCFPMPTTASHRRWPIVLRRVAAPASPAPDHRHHTTPIGESDSELHALSSSDTLPPRCCPLPLPTLHAMWRIRMISSGEKSGRRFHGGGRTEEAEGRLGGGEEEKGDQEERDADLTLSLWSPVCSLLLFTLLPLSTLPSSSF
jgi:hypothetical protein